MALNCAKSLLWKSGQIMGVQCEEIGGCVGKLSEWAAGGGGPRGMGGLRGGGKGAGGEIEKVEKCRLEEPSTFCLENNVAPLLRLLADIGESQRDRQKVKWVFCKGARGSRYVTYVR